MTLEPSTPEDRALIREALGLLKADRVAALEACRFSRERDLMLMDLERIASLQERMGVER